MKTYKILGVLLSYPDQRWIEALNEFTQCLDEERLLNSKSTNEIKGLINQFALVDLIRLQEEYVDTFDRGRGHCLNLFEHVYGESRDRGQAMVDLMQVYQQHGLNIDCGELPDYLPIYLEFLSYLPVVDAANTLGDTIDIIGAIHGRLKRRRSKYASIFSALISLSAKKMDKNKVAAAVLDNKDENKPEVIDKRWEEAAAFSNGISDIDGCSSKDNSKQYVNMDKTGFGIR